MKKINKSNYVFSLPTYSILLTRLRDWAKKAGVLPFTFHTARHTWASLNTSINDIRYVQQGLGHTSISMTQRYAHLQLDKRLEGIERYSDYLKKAREVYEERER
jgi:integrase